MLHLFASMYWAIVLNYYSDAPSFFGIKGFKLHHLDVRFSVNTANNQTVNKADYWLKKRKGCLIYDHDVWFVLVVFAHGASPEKNGEAFFE